MNGADVDGPVLFCYNNLEMKFTISQLETLSIAKPLQKPAACAKPLMLSTVRSKGKREEG